MTPERLLWDKSKVSKLVIPDNSLGIGPDKLLELNAKIWSFFKLPNSGQICPVRKLSLSAKVDGKLQT
jgi:hypothetical protein